MGIRIDESLRQTDQIHQFPHLLIQRRFILSCHICPGMSSGRAMAWLTVILGFSEEKRILENQLHFLLQILHLFIAVSQNIFSPKKYFPGSRFMKAQHGSSQRRLPAAGFSYDTVFSPLAISKTYIIYRMQLACGESKSIFQVTNFQQFFFFPSNAHSPSMPLSLHRTGGSRPDDSHLWRPHLTVPCTDRFLQHIYISDGTCILRQICGIRHQPFYRLQPVHILV